MACVRPRACDPSHAPGTEAQCADALFGWRWPAGFVCPECGHAEDFTALRTREPMQCRHCRHRTSLSAGTLFAHTKLPLTLWFFAMSLLTQRKNAISALALKRHLGVSCPTAWKVKHTFLQVMLERDADRQPSGVSEIDDVSRGGEVHGETPGRGLPDSARPNRRTGPPSSSTPTASSSATASPAVAGSRMPASSPGPW